MILAIVCALIAAAMAAWAVFERGRAARAEMKFRLLEKQTASGVEIIKAQDAVAQARIEAQLGPVTAALTRFERQVAEAEKARALETGGLKEQIAQLLAASTATQDEARKLSAALRRGAGVQGRWGEQMLRNVLEMAGMKAGVDFEEQFHVAGDGGGLRPDVVVRLPGGGQFVIDAKCSLNAFLEAQDAADDGPREAGYHRHAQSVRAHMQALAGKAYWDQLDLSPDFVVMFVPGDAFLAAATERLPGLYAEAMERRVIVVTPSSLFALCKAVAYGWRVEQQHVNAKEIAALGRELYKRLATMGGHAQEVGRALQNAVGKYNQFVGSLETQVLTQARRFEDLQVDHETRAIPELAPIEAATRPLVKLAPPEPATGAPALTHAGAAPTSAT